VVEGGSPWERHARWWQDGFTAGADPEYEEQILPLVDGHLGGCARVLEVGCGEGQVSRRVAALGAAVVGLDASRAQIDEARRRGGGPSYVRGGGEQLPFPGDCFDAVVVSLVLEHLEHFEPLLGEMARVLGPGGRVVLFLGHPIAQAPGSCWVDDADFAEQYWRLGPYLPDHLTVEEVAPGVELPFFHRPLGRYVHELGRVGLLVEDLVEPPPPSDTLAHLAGFTEAATIPRLLCLRARLVRRRDGT
jgi:SAM-dependent methyltransferase